jgi:predicted nucleic acid-binding protein
VRKVAVFDTNILFSEVGWKGKPFQCLELARAGVVDGVTCRELLDELAEKLQSKLSFTRPDA